MSSSSSFSDDDDELPRRRHLLNEDTSDSDEETSSLSAVKAEEEDSNNSSQSSSVKEQPREKETLTDIVDSSTENVNSKSGNVDDDSSSDDSLTEISIATSDRNRQTDEIKQTTESVVNQNNDQSESSDDDDPLTDLSDTPHRKDDSKQNITFESSDSPLTELSETPKGGEQQKKVDSSSDEDDDSLTEISKVSPEVVHQSDPKPMPELVNKKDETVNDESKKSFKKFNFPAPLDATIVCVGGNSSSSVINDEPTRDQMELNKAYSGSLRSDDPITDLSDTPRHPLGGRTFSSIYEATDTVSELTTEESSPLDMALYTSVVSTSKVSVSDVFVGIIKNKYSFDGVDPIIITAALSLIVITSINSSLVSNTELFIDSITTDHDLEYSNDGFKKAASIQSAVGSLQSFEPKTISGSDDDDNNNNTSSSSDLTTIADVILDSSGIQKKDRNSSCGEDIDSVSLLQQIESVEKTLNLRNNKNYTPGLRQLSAVRSDVISNMSETKQLIESEAQFDLICVQNGVADVVTCDRLRRQLEKQNHQMRILEHNLVKERSKSLFLESQSTVQSFIPNEGDGNVHVILSDISKERDALRRSVILLKSEAAAFSSKESILNRQVSDIRDDSNHKIKFLNDELSSSEENYKKLQQKLEVLGRKQSQMISQMSDSSTEDLIAVKNLVRASDTTNLVQIRLLETELASLGLKYGQLLEEYDTIEKLNETLIETNKRTVSEPLISQQTSTKLQKVETRLEESKKETLSVKLDLQKSEKHASSVENKLQKTSDDLQNVKRDLSNLRRLSASERRTHNSNVEHLLSLTTDTAEKSKVKLGQESMEMKNKLLLASEEIATVVASNAELMEELSNVNLLLKGVKHQKQTSETNHALERGNLIKEIETLNDKLNLHMMKLPDKNTIAIQVEIQKQLCSRQVQTSSLPDYDALNRQINILNNANMKLQKDLRQQTSQLHYLEDEKRNDLNDWALERAELIASISEEKNKLLSDLKTEKQRTWSFRQKLISAQQRTQSTTRVVESPKYHSIMSPSDGLEEFDAVTPPSIPLKPEILEPFTSIEISSCTSRESIQKPLVVKEPSKPSKPSPESIEYQLTKKVRSVLKDDINQSEIVEENIAEARHSAQLLIERMREADQSSDDDESIESESEIKRKVASVKQTLQPFLSPLDSEGSPPQKIVSQKTQLPSLDVIQQIVVKSTPVSDGKSNKMNPIKPRSNSAKVQPKLTKSIKRIHPQVRSSSVPSRTSKSNVLRASVPVKKDPSKVISSYSLRKEIAPSLTKQTPINTKASTAVLPKQVPIKKMTSAAVITDTDLLKVGCSKVNKPTASSVMGYADLAKRVPRQTISKLKLESDLSNKTINTTISTVHEDMFIEDVTPSSNTDIEDSSCSSEKSVVMCISPSPERNRCRSIPKTVLYKEGKNIVEKNRKSIPLQQRSPIDINNANTEQLVVIRNSVIQILNFYGSKLFISSLSPGSDDHIITISTLRPLLSQCGVVCSAETFYRYVKRISRTGVVTKSVLRSLLSLVLIENGNSNLNKENNNNNNNKIRSGYASLNKKQKQKINKKSVSPQSNSVGQKELTAREFVLLEASLKKIIKDDNILSAQDVYNNCSKMNSDTRLQYHQWLRETFLTNKQNVILNSDLLI